MTKELTNFLGIIILISIPFIFYGWYKENKSKNSGEKKFEIPLWAYGLWILMFIMYNVVDDKRVDVISQEGKNTLAYVTIADRTNRAKVIVYQFEVKDSLYSGGYTIGSSLDVLKDNFYEIRYLENDPSESVLMVKNKIDEMKDYAESAGGIVEETRSLGENTFFVRYRFSVKDNVILDSGKVQNVLYSQGDSVEVRYSTLRVQYRKRFALPMKSEIIRKK